MSRNNPSVFDDGHGPLSSLDERTGGVAGALLGIAIGYDHGGYGGALVGGLAGWVGGEELTDRDGR